MEILFHGASVTQQSGDFSYFNRLLEKFAGTQYKLRKHGYGGCHLNDACFVTINDDLKDGCEICVLDWNTTALGEFDDRKLLWIVKQITDFGALPVFIIFASTANKNANRQSEMQVIELCARYNFPLLDYRSSVDIDGHLRDGVHTNADGAEIYASLLHRDLLRITTERSRLQAFSVKLETNFSIRRLGEINLNIPEGGILSLSLGNLDRNCQIIARLVHGPKSPILKVQEHKNICLWDRWSHFSRSGIVALWYDRVPATDSLVVDIKVLPDAIDYSICAIPFSFSGIKVLDILDLWFVNCELADAGHLTVRSA